MRRGGEEDQNVEKLDEIRNEGQRDKVPFVSLNYDYWGRPYLVGEVGPNPRNSSTTAIHDDGFTEEARRQLYGGQSTTADCLTLANFLALHLWLPPSSSSRPVDSSSRRRRGSEK